MRNYTPLPWPYTARALRDGAAEEIAAALRDAIRLAEIELEPEALKKLTRIIYHLQNALRHLEAAGAQTKPSEL